MWKNNPLCLLEINNPTGHIMCCICSKENSISKKCINKIKYRRHTFERKANKFCTLLAQSDLPLDAFALSLPPLSSSCSYRHLLRICFRATAEFIAVSCGKASDRFYWVHWEAEYTCQPISCESHAALKNHWPSTQVILQIFICVWRS